MEIPRALREVLDWIEQGGLSEEDKNLLRRHTHDVGVWSADSNARRRIEAVFERVPPIKHGLDLYSGGEVIYNRFDFSGAKHRPYLTSSYDPVVANKYAESYGWMMTIHVPAGQKVLPLDTISVHGNSEREVLLPPQTKLVPLTRHASTKNLGNDASCKTTYRS